MLGQTLAIVKQSMCNNIEVFNATNKYVGCWMNFGGCFANYINSSTRVWKDLHHEL
jgi:hypothetical protein